jgi:DNA helicase HerA-like ATPase
LATNNPGLQQILYKDFIFCREYLDSELAIRPAILKPMGDLTFFRIHGMSDFWKAREIKNFSLIMADIANGIGGTGNESAFLATGNQNEIALYMGVGCHYAKAFEGSLQASYPYIKLSEAEPGAPQNILQKTALHGGLVTGYPTNKTIGETPIFQIERLIRGMQGKNWAYLVLAQSLDPVQVPVIHHALLNELNETIKMVKRTVSADGPMGKLSVEATNYVYQRYLENLGFLEEKLKIGRARGVWRTGIYYAADTPEAGVQLGNLIKGIYSGEKSRPEALRCVTTENIGEILSGFNLVGEQLPPDLIQRHPLMDATKPETVAWFNYPYQTILTSDDLATMMQIPREEVPGYFIDGFVNFETAIRRPGGNLELGSIQSGTSLFTNNYRLDLQELTRHGLIAGNTGGGKTNTAQYLLGELWKKQRIPFLVIESAKREYWELANQEGYDDLVLFTMGLEEEGKSVPYRLNPFEVMPGVALQTHIDYLLATFKASFELYPPMPYVLETCVYEIYQDRGWDVLTNRNIYGWTNFPTLEDLYYKVDVVTDRLGYHHEVESNVKAALKTRINSLRIGGKEAMLDTPHSIPIGTLLERPVVMELEDIGDDDIKAFIIGILLVQLYEYRKAAGSKPKLGHVLLLEEAHRLLANVNNYAGENANPKIKAIEFFCNLLAEIRSFGQGIMIVDQIPTKLAPDCLKNTNLKIVHRTVMKDDREAIGHSMNMTPEQIDYLSVLKMGWAAVYSEGDTRPKLVKVPLVEKSNQMTRQELIRKSRGMMQGVYDGDKPVERISAACAFCRERCEHYETVQGWFRGDKFGANEIKGVLEKASELLQETYVEDSWSQYIASLVGLGTIPYGIGLCFLGLMLKNSNVSESYQRNEVTEFVKWGNRAGVIN